MSGFLSGADVSCGPSSVLKGVNGRLDRDVSLQQVGDCLCDLSRSSLGRSRATGRAELIEQDRLISTPNVASSSRHVGQLYSMPLLRAVFQYS